MDLETTSDHPCPDGAGPRDRGERRPSEVGLLLSIVAFVASSITTLQAIADLDSTVASVSLVQWMGLEAVNVGAVLLVSRLQPVDRRSRRWRRFVVMAGTVCSVTAIGATGAVVTAAFGWIWGVLAAVVAGIGRVGLMVIVARYTARSSGSQDVRLTEWLRDRAIEGVCALACLLAVILPVQAAALSGGAECGAVVTTTTSTTSTTATTMPSSTEVSTPSTAPEGPVAPAEPLPGSSDYAG
jgi:MFS family permease